MTRASPSSPARVDLPVGWVDVQPKSPGRDVVCVFDFGTFRVESAPGTFWSGAPCTLTLRGGGEVTLQVAPCPGPATFQRVR